MLAILESIKKETGVDLAADGSNSAEAVKAIQGEAEAQFVRAEAHDGGTKTEGELAEAPDESKEAETETNQAIEESRETEDKVAEAPDENKETEDKVNEASGESKEDETEVAKVPGKSKEAKDDTLTEEGREHIIMLEGVSMRMGEKLRSEEKLGVMVNRMNSVDLKIDSLQASWLLDLDMIHTHRKELLGTKSLSKYIKKFPLFIKEILNQSRSSAYSYYRIMRMLQKHKMVGKLKIWKGGVIRKLDRITSAPHPKDFLDRFDKLEIADLEKELEKIKKETVNGYTVYLYPLDGGKEMPTKGRSLILVGKDENGLLFRIFDHEGNMIQNSWEDSLPSKKAKIAKLKTEVTPLWDKEKLSHEEMTLVAEFLDSVLGTKIVKHKVSNVITIQGLRAIPNKDNGVLVSFKNISQSDLEHFINHLKGLNGTKIKKSSEK